MFIKNVFQLLACKIYEFFSRQTKYYHFKKNLRKGHLIIGEHTYGIPLVQIYKGSEAKVIIGKYCSIAPDVIFITGGIHPVDWVSTFPFRAEYGLPEAYIDGMPTTKGDIIVGNDVWIGTHTLILSGVKIGNGAVICAGSVVTKDIPPYSIAGGVPAKVIKKRFTDLQIEQLEKIKWWDWEKNKIIEQVNLLSSPNIKEFIEKNRGKC